MYLGGSSHNVLMHHLDTYTSSIIQKIIINKFNFSNEKHVLYSFMDKNLEIFID